MRSELTMGGISEQLRVLSSWLFPCPGCGGAVRGQVRLELGRPCKEDPGGQGLVISCRACGHEVRALSREGLISAWNGERGTPPRPGKADEAEMPSGASLEARLAAIEGKLDRMPREAASSSTRASDSEPGSKRNPRHS